jgi:hypothetical protein
MWCDPVDTDILDGINQFGLKIFTKSDSLIANED